MKVEIPIASGFYESDSLPISAQQCINWRPNIVQAAGLSKETLFGTEGITQLATSGDGTHVNRGAHVKNGIAYYVNGGNLYRLNRAVAPDTTETFSMVQLGAIDGEGFVSMADNGKQLIIITNNSKGYIYDENSGTPFLEITVPGFLASGSPKFVVFIDGYFAATTDSKKWIISALNNGLAWNAVDVSTAESDPDIIVAPIVFRNKIFITGSETTEAFQNAPNGAGFPFIRSNLFISTGCHAPHSLIVAHNTFMMIGGGVNESPAIWMYVGATFKKVSTTAIDNVLSGFSEEQIRAAFAFSYSDRGAYFIGFTVGDFTIVYDVITQRWHERRSFFGNSDGRWRVNSLITAYGRVLVGDSQDGRVGELSSSVYTEYGNTIHRIVATQPFYNMGNSLKIPMIELTVESGVGNVDEVDPSISLDTSTNGKTFGYERIRKIGKIGEYDNRVIWYRNGRFSRFSVLRFRMSDPVKPVVIKLEVMIA